LKTLLREFQMAIETFQKLQQTAVIRSKEFVIQAQIVAHSEASDVNSEPEDAPLMLAQVNEQRGRQLANEISYNQALIVEREMGITEIQAAVNEVNDMLKNTGSLVSEQQYGFDNIMANVELASSRTRNAASELRIAEDYRRRRPLVSCWLIVIALLTSLIILAILLSI